MIKEYSAGAVIYKKENQQLKYLLVQSVKNNHWGFPKGHLEGVETPKQAAQREVLEETGLQPKFDFNFIQKTEYSLNKFRRKQVTFYLAEYLPGQKVKLQVEEILASKWVTFAQAKAYLLEHDKMKILAKAQEYLLR